MSDGSSGATALLGMDGFVVVEEDGELFISVETTASVVGCGSCGCSSHGTWPLGHPDAGPSLRWKAGSSGVEEAKVDLSGPRLCIQSRSPSRAIWSRTH